MKKSLILSLAGLFLFGGVVFAAPSSNRNQIPEPTQTGIKLSSLRIGSTEDDAIRVFKLVRFSTQSPNQAAVVSGDALVYDTNSADGVSVRYTTTSADGSFAGIAVTTIQSADAGSTTAFDDLGHRNWGWICVHGPVLANNTAGGTNGAVAGSIMITSTDSGKITTTSSPGTAVDGVGILRETQAAANKGGFVLKATAATTGTSTLVFVENT